MRDLFPDDRSSNLWYSCTGTTGPTTVPFLLNGYCVLSATDTAPTFLSAKFTAGISIIGTTSGSSTGGTQLGVTRVLGAGVGIASGQVYTALTDGFVLAVLNSGGTNVGYAQLLVNGAVYAQRSPSTGMGKAKSLISPHHQQWSVVL